MSTSRTLSLLSRALTRSTLRPLQTIPRTRLLALRPFTTHPRLALPSESIPTSSIPYKASNATTPIDLTDAEQRVHASLMAGLSPTALTVQDISGGCGSMFAIEIESECFRGVGVLAQQRMVNALLKEQMDREGWHGVQIKTTVG